MVLRLLLTKIRKPQRRKDIIRRARLIDALHQNVFRKLSFINAPAGYGKTSLLLDFASDLDLEVCWFHLTRGDEDLKRFAQYFIGAFQERFPGFGRPLQEILEGSEERLDPTGLAAEIINEMHTFINDICIMFIDDFHIAGQSAAIAEFLEFVLDQLPDQVRLVIASRSTYGIPAAHLYVRNEIATLGEEELRFRPDEIQAIMRKNFRRPLPDETAQELAKRSDGWIVAIMLALQTMEDGPIPSFEGATDQVYGFLAGDVIQNEPKPLREFMLATSIVDEFTAPLSSYLMDLDNAEDTISKLEERSLFITRVETKEGTSYRYHQLFVEFLRDRLETHHSDWLKSLHRRAAEWYAQQEAWEAAMHHKLAAGDMKEAAIWVNKIAKTFFIAGNRRVLSQWFNTLSPHKHLEPTMPELILNQAKIQIDQGNYDEGERLLNCADKYFAADHNIDQQINVILSRGMICRFRGQWKEAKAFADQAQLLLKNQDAEHPQNRYRWYQAARLQGYSLTVQGEIKAGFALFEEIVSGLRELEAFVDGDMLNQVRYDLTLALGDLGHYRFQYGFPFEAKTAFEEVLKIRRRLRRNHHFIALALNNTGYLNYKTGRTQQAILMLQEAQELIKSLERGRIATFIFNTWGEILRDLEEWEQARDVFDRSIKIAEDVGDPARLAAAYDGLMILEHRQGNFSEAFHFLREATRLRKESSEHVKYKAEAGRIYKAMGQHKLAAAVFEDAFYQWDQNNFATQVQARTGFVYAAALFGQGKKKEAKTIFENTLTWAAQLGYNQFLVIEGRYHPAFIEFLSKEYKENPQVLSLLRKISQFKTGLKYFEEPDTEEIPKNSITLEIRAFGNGEVRYNGDLIPKSRWKSRQARGVFFYIVENGGAASADIKNKFWPEFNTSKANSNFQATLWRVRRALGQKNILLSENGKFLLTNNVRIWYDVGEFRSMLKQAASETISEHARTEFWREAVDLYHQDYLEDIFLDWSQETREELQSMYIHTLRNLAEWENDRNNYLEARGYYEQILTKNPFRDDIRLSLMECFVHEGAPSEAKTFYLQTKAFLQSEGLEPTQELTDYYQQLL